VAVGPGGGGRASFFDFFAVLSARNMLKKSVNCRGCGSSKHKAAFCPNLPCEICAGRHARGMLDCPLFTAAKERCAEKAKAAKAALRKAKAAEKAAAAAAAKALVDAAAAAELQERWAQYRELLREGIAEPNRSQFTAKNWGLQKNVWHCAVCRGTRAWCVCSERV